MMSISASILKEAQELNGKSMPIIETRFLPIEEQITKNKFDWNKIYPPAPICLEIMEGGNKYIIGTTGNFSAIIGKAKSRKSSLVSILLAAFLKKGSLMDRFCSEHINNQHTAILFDTEQPMPKLSQIANRIANLSEIPKPKDLHIYYLREYSPKERVTFIEEVLERTPNIGLVVIDGVKDLVISINDEHEATEITTKLLKWSGKYNIHIVTIIHQNKADFNARGHLGTEIVNKSETVMSVSKNTEDESISLVEPEYCREKEFKSFSFSMDMHGNPYMVDNIIASENKKISAFDIAKETHISILKSVFEKEPGQNFVRALFQKINTKYIDSYICSVIFARVSS